MIDIDLQELERFVAENDDLLSLEEQIGRFNIFDALGVARVEIRHSNFLAWLITPGESHGQGDLFLKSMLMDVLRKSRQQGIDPPVSPVELDGADLGGVEIRREWRNIDLLITCDEPRFVIAIENKIDSGEHSNQLQRYEDTISEHFPGARCLFVFLTPEGDEASEENWISYSYADLHKTLTRTRKTNQGAIGGDVAVFLEHYLSLVGNRFMENEDIDKLCRQIYSNHRRALDLIWERVGAPESGILGAIEQWLEERNEHWLHIRTRPKEIEFLPVAWRDMLPAIGKRPNIESRHWMSLRLNVGKPTCVRLMVVACPTNHPEIRMKILDRILKDKSEFGFKTFFTKKGPSPDWTRLLTDEVCALPEDEELEPNAIIEKIEKRLNEFVLKTASLPAAIKELGIPIGR